MGFNILILNGYFFNAIALLFLLGIFYDLIVDSINEESNYDSPKGGYTTNYGVNV